MTVGERTIAYLTFLDKNCTGNLDHMACTLKRTATLATTLNSTTFSRRKIIV